MSRFDGKNLPWFNLISMPARRSLGRGRNDRLYDPLTGQFLSPDSYVQDPYFSQSLNRYSYCLNNPLKYIDPTGFTLNDLMRQNYYGSFNYWIESNAAIIESGGYRNSHSTGTFTDANSGLTFTRRSDGSTKIYWSEFSFEQALLMETETVYMKKLQKKVTL
jgi:RHS repeat-associated protein